VRAKGVAFCLFGLSVASVSGATRTSGIKTVEYPETVRAAGRLWREIGSGVSVSIGSNRPD
jgi:hypothetical protein